MTSSEKNLAPVELDVSRVETIHVENGSQKIASLCIVLKDSEIVDKLSENPFPFAKMIITDVVPSTSNPNQAQVFFRGLTNAEITEMSQQFLLPAGSLAEIFGEAFGDILGSSSDDDFDDENIVGQAEDLYEDDSENDDDEASVEETIASILDAQNLTLPEEDTTLYVVTVSLAEAHLAQVLCVRTNAPAFVLTSEKIKAKADKEQRLAVWQDFISILEFPFPDTPEYFDSTASLIQAVTGIYPLSLDPQRINGSRAELMNRILRLSGGSQKALLEGFSMINPLNKLTKNDTKENKPNREDAEAFFIKEAIDKIYLITSPQAVAALIHEAPNMAEYIEEVDALNEIFRESGIEDLFNEVIAEEGATQTVPFSPTASSSREDLIAYYSSNITPQTLPEGMIDLANKIQMPLLYDYNWAGGAVALEPTPSNVGEITVAKLITIAVRFSRLKRITRTVKSNLNPIGFLIQGLNMPGENSLWSFSESIILLKDEKEGDLLFQELVRTSLPDENSEEGFQAERAMNSAAAMLFHNLGHRILDEEWDKETLLVSLKDKKLISSFISDVFSSANGDNEDENRPGPCPIQLATMSALALQPSVTEIVEQLASVFRFLAKLNVLKHTDYAEDSVEWKEYIEKYLRSILQETGFDPRRG